MSSQLTSILACLCGSEDDYPADRKTAPEAYSDSVHATDDELASKILDILRNADKDGPELNAQVSGVVSPQGWTEGIAKSVLNGLELIIKNGREKVGGALHQAIEAAEAAAKACFTFAREHPYLTAGFLTIVAVGVLVWLTPWAVEALGFGEFGPVAGTSFSVLPDVVFALTG